MRYFLLDKITEVEVDKYVKGVKAITLSDPILHDHFPDHPIMPGALIIEGLAQLAGFLLEVSFNKTDEDVKRAIFVMVDKMKFYKFSGPGELLNYHAKIESLLGESARVTVEATSNNELRAKGKLTFQMMELNSKRVHEHRVNLYRTWTRELENCPTLR